MKLVHLTTVPETLHFLAGQARHLAPHGIEVVAISSPGEALDRFGRTEGVPCFSVSMERGISPLRDGVALARLTALLRRLRPTIVDAHTPKAGLLGMAAARLAGVPVRIFHLHGIRFATERGFRRRLLRGADRVSAALATRVVAVSASLAREAAAERIAGPGRIVVLANGSINGVDGARFRPPSDADRRAARAALGLAPGAPVIGFVGRLARDKGIAELARAWDVLRREREDLRLVLVGAEEPRDPVPQGIAESLRADPRVLKVGFALDTLPYYRAMDVVALPSYREGFPVVPLEAAAMALPVVAARVTGSVDAVLDGVTGTLVPPRDAGALTDALRRYVSDEALRARHGEAARARVLRDFDPGRIRAALHEEYVRLAARAGVPLEPARAHAGAP